MDARASPLFSSYVTSAFNDYLLQNPSARRITSAEKQTIIEWMTNSARPSSQREHSRLNYVRRTLSWDEVNQNLFAHDKADNYQRRLVVTEDQIVDLVAEVHEDIKHLGWDATWKEVTSLYYGILRTDVIFLLKRCPVCALNPTKRPKGTPTGGNSGIVDDDGDEDGPEEVSSKETSYQENLGGLGL